ncbi:hypothetical protein AJ79_00714 [Helicocarpus griseus UAMH5409]|uniref:Uncharacterized protein n=1 Tax=Helicocarpus griseus UAMH5409 TaxID=1447875 RepID=A0A2B7Y9A0_9EURO|nr:hypothetical protein AJ79_00714 [Helicocarpus griseus UAMH5409]
MPGTEANLRTSEVFKTSDKRPQYNLDRYPFLQKERLAEYKKEYDKLKKAKNDRVAEYTISESVLARLYESQSKRAANAALALFRRHAHISQESMSEFKAEEEHRKCFGGLVPETPGLFDEPDEIDWALFDDGYLSYDDDGSDNAGTSASAAPDQDALADPGADARAVEK